MTPVSGSTYAITDASKSPATIHVKSELVKLPPCHTRANATHEARKAHATAGTATQ